VAERPTTRHDSRTPHREQLTLSYPPREQLSLETAHRLNGLLQSIIASVAILRMTGHESAHGERAAAEILERTKQIGELVASLARSER
jgi:hypothetical protein